MKRTPFYQCLIEMKAELIDRGGWLLAKQYTDPLEEYYAVRERAGIIDYCTMGEIDIKGKDASRLLQKVIVNDVERLEPGGVLYSTICNEQGGILDDTTVYCFNKNHYWVVSSSAGRYTTTKWLQEQGQEMNVAVTDVTSGWTLLSLQGPKSRDILRRIVKDVNLDELTYYSFAEGKLADVPAIISRTGFTGELGYELYAPSEYAIEQWNIVIDAGKTFGIQPYGLTAANMLRLEKGYIGGNDYNPNVTPLEVGLDWTVRFYKDDFIGKKALVKMKNDGLPKKLVGFELSDTKEKLVPPKGSKILSLDHEVIGEVTSAIYSPLLDKVIGMGFVQKGFYNEGTELFFEFDNKLYSVVIVPKPFYDPKGERLRS